MSEKSKSFQYRGGLTKTPVAIIGLASIMPEAHHLQEYWDNILNKINCITDIHEDRWKIEDYYDADPSKPDKVYCKRGGFIPDIDFDPMEFGLPPNILEVTDVSQLLGLVVARDALQDAGYGEDREWNRENTGVILGLVGMSAKTFVPLMNRLQYPIWERVLRASGVSDADCKIITEKIKKAYIGWEENSFPGTLANVVAGRIANRFDLGGTNCVIDAACGSSLAALKMALEELVEGRVDMMISGGVDTDNTIATYMSFSKTPAFTKDDVVKTFDADSSGMMVGEGLGMVVLKRLEDAERDGDRIYAVIRGIGSSSDGRFKSIYAPRPQGQALALRRAYMEAGYAPATVGLIEAHGTGTAAGDPAEVQGLREVFGENNPNRQYIALGSIKSQIGHTKATAGTASLIKTALALHHKVLPATINVTRPNPKLDLETSPLYINSEVRPWFRRDPEVPRRAGVSAFGFGGTNFHVALEEYTPDHAKPFRLGRVARPVILAAETPAQLLALAQEAQAKLKSEQGGAYFIELSNASKAAKIPGAQARVGFVAASQSEALDLVQTAIDALKAQPQAESWENPKGIFYRKTGMDATGKVVALFPGQGSQYLEMGKELAINFPTFRQAFEAVDALYRKDGLEPLSGKVYPIPVFDPKQREALDKTLQQTQNAQPAIGTMSAGLFKLMQAAGFQPSYAAGHSFGEWTALWAAGVLTDDEYYAAAKARGQAMAAPDDPNFDAGTMLAVKGDVEKVKEAIRAFPAITLANYNSNNQVVLAGARADVAQVQKALADQGFSVVPLQVSAAFHTPLVGHAQKPFAKALKPLKFKSPSLKVYSNSSGKQHPADGEAIRSTMVDHILNPVYFKDEIEAIYAEGGSVFVECGPKAVLTGLVDSILGDRPHIAVALNGSAKKDSDRQLREAFMRLRITGLELGDIDPFEIERKPVAPKKMSAVTVKLSGAFYRPAKSHQAYEDGLKDGWKISQAEPQVVVKQVEKIVEVPVPASSQAHPAAPVSNGSGLAALEQILARFESQQKESLRIHEQYLNNDSEYGKIYSQLTQLELGVLANNPNPTGLQALEGLERSMNRFHDHQAETLRVHEQYLRSQDEFSRNFVALVQQQMQAGPVAAAAPVARPQPASVAPRPAPAPVKAAAPAAPAPEAQPSNGNGAKAVVAPTPAPVAVPAPAPIPAAAAPKADVRSALLAIVSEKTGYPQEMLDVNMDMEADLGIDSIKRVEILGALQGQIPEMPKPEPEALAELRTLAQILDFMGARLTQAVPVQQATPAAPQASVAAAPAALHPSISAPAAVADMTAALLAVVSEKTGYPQEMLDLAMDMEADLGIDSIKRVEILGALQTQFPEMPKPEPEVLAELRTLGQVAEFVRGHNQAPAAVPAAIPAAAAPASVQQPVQEPAAPAAAASAAAVTTADITQKLLKVVSEKTGYPQEMLDLNMDMEADLGIDSIKRVEILGAVQQVYPDLPKPEPEKLAELRTLQNVIDFLAQGSQAIPAAEVQRPFA